ncbi:hypothetical protein QLS71_014405 [Mariniflexile litorale]|uniref:Glycosyl hydrolase family 65 n=1 Tax=Mariniflexile litorale TaxID=3045158 RepID=A0AAU7EEG5_9FLAO|nr:hypothetical protein [Mariniflexile sp. KMM 9835]MDQ8212884.1 hypothetical protein [Mariniflexile sp. KMM 9835]
MKKLLFYGLLLVMITTACKPEKQAPINRKALVERNNPQITAFDSLASLSVGNGNFTFTTGLTGLQTFYEDYEKGMPLGTQSNWGWHTFPNTENYKIEETLKYYEVEGRMVPFRHQLKDSPRSNGASNYFRENAQRLHLGMVQLELMHENGERAKLEDIREVHHDLDMWTGKVTSAFIFDGMPVKVEVLCDQESDMISARITSHLIDLGRLSVSWKFPAGVPSNTHAGYNFDAPETHQSELKKVKGNRVEVLRTLDADHYAVGVEWKGNASFNEVDKHYFKLSPEGGDIFEFSSLYTPESTDKTLKKFTAVEADNVTEWTAYWENGGMVDFSASKDSRAKELERRVVLSQYLTKIQSTGNMPPAETGLTYNSWYGKFHLEMHWWHISHFAQWNRSHLMEEQLEFYNTIFDKALKTAQDQGYKGVRWPKMIDPSGENSPSSVGSYLIWQQPHIIWFAEQMYRDNPSQETLEKYKKLVLATAEFMADFPTWNEEQQQYNLEAPLIPAQEHWSRETTKNPPFELAYWHWALTKAQEWRTRLGMEADKTLEDVRLKLASPDQANGVYLGVEGAVDSYDDVSLMRDHPMVLGAYGILSGWDKVDPEVMRKTIHVIADRWNWESTWGWDYPLSAMSAVRLGEPELALEFLLKDVQKNTYLKNGHNYQSERLRVYLPGNGGLLQTVAMMCAGWDGCEVENPGFPKDGNWNVVWEDLKPMP